MLLPTLKNDVTKGNDRQIPRKLFIKLKDDYLNIY